MSKIIKWIQNGPFLAGKNGAVQELSCKNGAGQKNEQINVKLVGKAAPMGVFFRFCSKMTELNQQCAK